MTFYVVRRIFISILLLFFMSIAFFALTRATPGLPLGSGENPRQNQARIDRRIHELGLDKPWYEQYPDYLNSLAHADLGNSYVYDEPVSKLMADRVPNSVLLLGTSLVVSLLIAIPLGIFAATRQDSPLDMSDPIARYVRSSSAGFVVGIFLLLAGDVC